MKELFYMTRVLHDLGEAGSSEKDGVREEMINSSCFQKIYCHSFIYSLHALNDCIPCGSHPTGCQRQESENHPHFLVEASIPMTPMSVHFSTASSPVYHTWVTSVKVRYFLNFSGLSQSWPETLDSVINIVIKSVAAFHTPASSHVLSHNKPIIASVSIL